jgi:3,4-dihydroxy 2-butanone 4-phosphate synthase / GTP cyclohydrolase II
MKRPYLVTPGEGPTSDGVSEAISPIEDIIEDARNGRPYILVDAEDRENEGDVIIPAQFATPEQINFMAKHARGLICLSITSDRARQLRLPPMATDNQSGHGTAFTVSIEAREGVTTGISAHDRAHTIAVAIDPTKGPDDIVSPGHVFPLVAKDGGVLIRAGHTEAAVDISRMAGLVPAGVICEIMKDDGSMARLPDLVAFAQLHGLKIGTIADLIAYRRRTERQVERVLETPFDSTYGGRFRMVIYRNVIDQTEHVVLTKGRIEAGRRSCACTASTWPPTCLGRWRSGGTTCPRRWWRSPATMAQAWRSSSATPTRTGCRNATASPRPTTRATSCATTASARRSCSTWVCATCCCSPRPRPCCPAPAATA